MSCEWHTKDDVDFETWLAECDTWWDMTRGDEAYDHPWLDWREWYEAGFSVERACRHATAALYGGEAD